MKRSMTGFVAIASVMLAFGGAEPVRWSGNLVKEISCVSAGQNNFDFEIPFSLTGCWGVSFVPELPAEQILQIDEAFFFFRTGSSVCSLKYTVISRSHCVSCPSIYA